MTCFIPSMANALTAGRILCSMGLLLCPALSQIFYVLYLVGGFTDMADGFIARKTGTVGAYGAKFDTVADIIFTLVSLSKLIPVIEMPSWIWAWITIIALLKGINIISGFIVQGRFVPVHTAMNKVAGALLFLLPLTLPVIKLIYSAVVVCTIATCAAVGEGYNIIVGVEAYE